MPYTIIIKFSIFATNKDTILELNFGNCFHQHTFYRICRPSTIDSDISLSEPTVWLSLSDKFTWCIVCERTKCTSSLMKCRILSYFESINHSYEWLNAAAFHYTKCGVWRSFARDKPQLLRIRTSQKTKLRKLRPNGHMCLVCVEIINLIRFYDILHMCLIVFTRNMGSINVSMPQCPLYLYESSIHFTAGFYINFCPQCIKIEYL